MDLRAVAVVGVLACACVEAGPAEVAIKDKQAMFGDAGLVPTREGERLRREVAAAGELERLLKALEVSASVSVDLREPAGAVIVARGADAEQVRALAAAALPIESARIHVVALEQTSLANPPTPTDRPLLALLAAAFGLALGVSLERGLARRAAERGSGYSG